MGEMCDLNLDNDGKDGDYWNSVVEEVLGGVLRNQVI